MMNEISIIVIHYQNTVIISIGLTSASNNRRVWLFIKHLGVKILFQQKQIIFERGKYVIGRIYK